MVYSVGDRNEAAMIFETTNDRGKMLTNLEKTKSFLMYKVSTTFKSSTSLLDTIQQGFNDIYNTYEELKGKPKFNLDENSIQQYMFIAYEAWENRNIKGRTIKAYQHYLDELKETINERTKAIHASKTDLDKEDLKNELNDYIERYINQLKGSFNAIKGMFDDGDEFNNLLTLNRVASLYPILIKVYSLDDSKTKSEFKSLCKWCEIFCFRGLTILKYLSNKFQDTWYALARDFTGDYAALYDRIRNMIMSLGDDDKFIEKLSSKDFFNEYSSQDRNYFFWSYENYLRQYGGYSLLSHADLWQTDSRKKLTIEHIVAQSDEKEKCRILKSDKFIKVGQRAHFDKEYLHSIGNLTIDPLSANASKGNKPVDKKNSNYFTTAPLMSQNELDNFMQSARWTLKSIETRKDKLLKFAHSKWCFNAPTKTLKIDDDADFNDTELIED